MRYTRIRRRAGLVPFAALCLGLSLTALAGRQSNESYIISKDSINAGGGRSLSADYILTGSVGQSSAVGRSANTLAVNVGGFWGGGETERYYTLTVEKSGSGSGTVSSDGIDCGADCSEQYPAGTLVLLQAAEDACSGFVEWQVNGQMVTGPISVTEDLVVTAVFGSTCPAATMALYEAFDLENRSILRDPTILPLAPGTVPATDEILLPDLSPLFDFPAEAHFHFQYANTPGQILKFVPEQPVTALLLNEAYSSVGAGDISGLSVWPEGKTLTTEHTVILQTTGGRYFKVGYARTNKSEWTVSFNYEELQP